MEMFCRQCEQTAGGKGCDNRGVCGKDSDVAALQDLLLYELIDLAAYAQKARELGIKCLKSDIFLQEGLFTTVTNVNFDPASIYDVIRKAHSLKTETKEINCKECSVQEPILPKTLNDAIELGKKFGIMTLPAENEDIRSLKELLLYGIKGLAAYADHANILGQSDEQVVGFFYKALSALADKNITLDELIALNMECGQVNLKCMEILDKGNTTHFGNPVPTKVSLGIKKGSAILVSGHDLLDLEELLKQTKGKGINVYTHGEMLPAHGYPELKKYSHLVGNYGGAWQDQAKEFAEFPGAILMTTNCIQRPADSYKDRMFTTGLVGWPDVKHIADRKAGGQKDFSMVIKKAMLSKGFKEDVEGKEILVGFGHNAVMSVAGAVIDAVKSGAVKHFFLIGGCDGAKPGRNYYTEFAEKVPQDCVILTLACGKYRFNKLDFGTIGGIPRLLDIGQCNDAYSAVQIALALSQAFNCGVNDLPLSLILSWYEQKAVVILLTLLSLGIKNIKLGPSLPAFVSPNVLNVLVQNFNIAPITTPDQDLAQILKK